MKRIWILIYILCFSVAILLYTLSTRVSDIEKPNYQPTEDGSTESTSIEIIPTEIIPTINSPDFYVIDGGNQIFQTFNNCGPASLSMALSFYDINVGQDILGQALRPYQHPTGDNDDKSVTLDEIAKKAEEYNFTAYHRPNGDIEKLKKFISNDIPVITRTILEPDSDIGHYRVVYGYDDTTQEIIQNDSLQGKGLHYSYDLFLNIWSQYNYEYLVLIPEGKETLAKNILGEEIDSLIAWQNRTNEIEIALVRNPDDIFLRFSSAVAYYNVGEYEKSVEAYERVENKLPFRTIWYQVEPLLAYKELMKYDELLPKIEEILRNNNRAFSELYMLHGEIYLEQGKTQAAQNEFDKAIMYNSNFIDKVPNLN